MTSDEKSDPVDRTKLKNYLESKLGPGEEVTCDRLKGGNANETFLVQWGNEEYVLRKPPVGEPVTNQLHNISREFKIFRALHGTPVPVPEPVIYCSDRTVIGDEFYLMERLEGDFLSDGVPERFQSPNHKQELGEAIITGLVAIHEFDESDVPFESAIGTDEYLNHEVGRWSDQLDRVTSITESERSLPNDNTVADWLKSNTPESEELSLVHGDYKPDNLMFGPETPPNLIGVLDWEMSAIGDPLTDLGWLLTYWADPGDENTTARTYMQDEGFPDRSELVAQYEAQSGRTFVDDRFYRVLAVFKLAAICEGFYAAYLNGAESTKQTYPMMEYLVPELLTRAERIINGAEPI